MVHIITDTTACLPHETARRYDIPVIPQIIHFNDVSYQEGIDLQIDTFMEWMKSAIQLPKTAAPPPELFIKEFERLVPTGETILCLHPSAEVSGTVRSAQVAANEFPGADIRVIDTRIVASPLATLVEHAAGWAQAGLDADTIEARVLEMAERARIYFMVPSLEYLAKGGRIGGATALLGSMLQIKPILTFENGRVNIYERVRTQHHALARLRELALSQAAHRPDSYLSVMHAGVLEQGQALARDLAAQMELSHVPVYHMPPAIVTHGGPGLLGVAFFTESQLAS